MTLMHLSNGYYQMDAEYMELVRDSWLTCRGPQRKFAKNLLANYDRERKEIRRAIRDRYIALSLLCLAALSWFYRWVRAW